MHASQFLGYTSYMIAQTLKKIRKMFRHLLIGHLSDEHLLLQKKLEQISLAIGKQDSARVASMKLKHIQEAEFKIFSQFGEDGIIQYLVHHIRIPNKTFVELGVGNYEESNTRFLLMNNNWKGIIVNAGTEHLEYLRSEMGKSLRYLHQLEALSAFITKKNVNSIISQQGVVGDIGLLSIDLDGVDYWIFHAIDCISPRILVMEFNSLFGDSRAITVPYKETFDRRTEHYSNLYFGASLPALMQLTKKKGYVFIGSNSTGNNAFFVRKDVARSLPHLTAKQGYIENLYRESMDKKGQLTYISDHKERLKLIMGMRVFNVVKNIFEKV